LWRWRDGELTHYTTKQGLLDNRIVSITEDRAGNLWLGSSVGILRVTKKSIAAMDAGETTSLDCISFDVTEGLPPGGCMAGSQTILRGRDGRLWIAMSKGIVVVSPEKIRTNPVPPPVILESVLVDNGIVPLPQRIHAQHCKTAGATAGEWAKLTTSPGRHTVEFRFTANSLAAPEKVRFRYQLDGIDSGWRDSGARRFASYPALPPGNYRFRVIAANNDGLWNEAGATITFTIPVYFWQTRWFPAAALTGFMVLVGIAREYRGRRLRELDRMRLRIARDLHDQTLADLRNLALLVDRLPTTRSSSFRDGLRAATDQSTAGQVPRLNEDLDESIGRSDPSALRAEIESISHEVRRICEDLSPSALENVGLSAALQFALAHAVDHAEPACKFDYEFICEDSLDEKLNLPQSTQIQIYRIAQEALSNVCRHAGAKHVKMNATVSAAETFELRIEDDGRGFDEAAARKNSGRGVANIRGRASMIAAEASWHKRAGAGTVFELRLPQSRKPSI
jgi:hypothetical protein